MRLCALAFFAALSAWAQQSPIVKSVEPKYPKSMGVYTVENVGVRVIVLPDGEPYALAEADHPLPGYVMKALMEYRFERSVKGVSVTFSLPIRTPVEETTSVMVRRLVTPSDRITSRTRTLTVEQARKLETSLPEDLIESDAHAMLAWFAASQQDPPLLDMQGTHLFWLMENAINASLLESSAAQLPPLAPAFGQVRERWLKLLAAYPNDRRVLAPATLFLAPHEPQTVIQALTPQLATNPEAKLWIGEAYAYAALGTPSLGGRGWPPTTILLSLPETPEAVAARSALSTTTEMRILTSAQSTIKSVAARMAGNRRDVTAVLQYCETLLARIKQMDEKARFDCVLPKESTIRLGGFNGQVQKGNIRNRVSPAYPPAARDRGIQGTVRLRSIIDTKGKISSLWVISGPFALYESAYDAVKQWEWEPYRIDGIPVEVFFEVEVNYTLSR